MRKIIAALVALAVGLMLPFATPGTAEAASKKFTVSISAPKTIARYSNITIKGRIKPARATKVVIQKKWPGKKWKKIATVWSSANGSYAYTYYLTESSSRQYRTYVPKSGKIKAAYSKTVSVKVVTPARSSASVNITGTGPTTLTAGDNFVVSGTASANLVGKTVVLSMGGSSGWSDLTTTTVAADSTFRLSAPATLAGAGQVLKVYAPATPTTYYAESGTATFSVYGWYYLSERTIVEGNGFWKGDVAVNGQDFSRSVATSFTATFSSASGPYTAQFDLARKCTSFVATAGWVDDRSAASIVGNAAVYKDDATAWSQTGVRFGTSNPINVDITGALRLKLQAQRTGSYSVGGALAFGDARILCAF